MTLKLGMQLWVLKHYQVYSNDDPGLTLTYFTARLNLVPYAFVWEKGKTMDFFRNYWVYDVKVDAWSSLNEYMNIYEYQRSRSFIYLGTRSPRFNIFKLLFLRNHWADWSQSSCGQWDEGIKVCSNGPGHMTKMAAMPIYGKNMKNSSLEPKGWWPWKFVCCIGYSRTTKFVQMMTPRLTLTYFTARSNLVPYAFVWEKVKTMDFSETIVP